MDRTSESDTGGESRGRHLDEDACLDLLYGLLSPADRDRMLSHLAVCPTCEKSFRQKAAERERLRALGVPETTRAPRSVQEGAVEGDKAPPAVWGRLRDYSSRILDGIVGASRQPRLRIGGAVALAMVVLLLIAWPRSELHLLPEYSDSVRFRSAMETGSLTNFVAGLEAYADEKFRRAIDLLERAEVPAQYEVFRSVYLASALAWSSRYADAAEVLGKVDTEMLPEPWRGEAAWTLYVSLKESGRPARADSVLTILAQDPGDVGERARRCLHQ